MNRNKGIILNDKDIKAIYKVLNFVIDEKQQEFMGLSKNTNVDWDYRSQPLCYDWLVNNCEHLDHPYAQAVYLLSELEGVRND